MFKNAVIYRLAPHLGVTVAQAEEALGRAQFSPCGPTQEHSCGWTPARGVKHGAFVETQGQHWVMRYKSESKSIPADVLGKRVDAKAAGIEHMTGRKPGKKERRELKAEARLDLLPHAFPREAETLVWLDIVAGILVIDAASQSRADDVVSLLVETMPGFSLSFVQTQTSPQAAMAHWLLSQEPPVGFSIDRECELQSNDESKARVRYARHPLDIAEVQGHIKAGKLPTLLALTWEDRVSFVLTAGLHLRSIEFLDVAVQDYDGGTEFDTNAAIATGEMSELIADVLAALGGEVRP